jgi:flagellar biosynthesis/type III secretory pathway protein FliH
LLVIPIFLFLNSNNATATYLSDNYGNHLTYQTLNLYDDFDYTEYYYTMIKGDNEYFVFEYQSVEESLEDFMYALGDKIVSFMKIYTPPSIFFEYLPDLNETPSGNYAWTVQGYIYIIVKTTVFNNPENPLTEMEILATFTNIDTWVFSETTDDYSLGYDHGYDDGYEDGLDDGYVDGYVAGLDAGYDVGYDDGYDAGYEVGEYEGYDLGHSNGYSEGYDAGQNVGYVNGYNDGFDFGHATGLAIGYADGYDEGHDDGYEEGLEVGYEEGYNEGHIDGYNEGSTNSFISKLDKWIVPIVIVVVTAGVFLTFRRGRE